MLKAIAFDGNGVLYYREGDFVDRLMEYVRDRHLPGLDPAHAAAVFRRCMELAFDGSIGKAEAIERFMNQIGLREDSAVRDVAGKELEFSRRVRLFPTEKETLLELDRRGFKMGMITNTFQPAREKAAWFEQMGLGCAVRTVVSSIDFGASKPDVRIYHEFCRIVGVPPSETAYVAHEEFEIRGAAAAGMITISFEYKGGLKADHHLTSFNDLLGVAERLAAGSFS